MTRRTSLWALGLVALSGLPVMAGQIDQAVTCVVGALVVLALGEDR